MNISPGRYSNNRTKWWLSPIFSTEWYFPKIFITGFGHSMPCCRKNSIICVWASKHFCFLVSSELTIFSTYPCGHAVGIIGFLIFLNIKVNRMQSDSDKVNDQSPQITTKPNPARITCFNNTCRHEFTYVSTWIRKFRSSYDTNSDILLVVMP